MPPAYLKFALRVEKSFAVHCFKDVFELVSFTAEVQRSWQRRGVVVK